MKKITLTGLISLSLLFACSSEENSNSDTTPINNPSGPTIPNINGSLSPEEGKAQLESNAIEMLNKMESFESDSALEQIVELAEFLTAEDSAKKLDNNFEAAALNTISGAAYSKKDAVFTTNVAEDTTLDEFNEAKGVYTWNDELDDFDKTGDSDDIIYNIAYNNKNATFSITEFNTVMAADNTEAPTLLKSSLKINDVEVMSQDYKASIDAGKTVPNSISNTTSIGGFNFLVNYTNINNSKISQSFSFKIGEDQIIGFNNETNGNFAAAENEDAEITDVLDNATTTLSFLNATVILKANDKIASGQDLTIDEQIELLNNNVTSELVINNKSVAKGEFYKDEDEYTYTTYDYNTDTYVDVVETEEIVNARFLFADDSSADFDTYFENSFLETENKLESVIDTFDTLFKNISLGSDSEENEVYYIDSVENN